MRQKKRSISKNIIIKEAIIIYIAAAILYPLEKTDFYQTLIRSSLMKEMIVGIFSFAISLILTKLMLRKFCKIEHILQSNSEDNK